MHNRIRYPFQPPIYFKEDDGTGTGDGGGGDPKPDPKPETDPKPKTITVEENNRIVSQRVEEAKRSATQEMATTLGVSLEEAKTIIDAHNAKVEGEKSDAQKAREAADREKADAATEKTASAQARHEANVERVIIRALPVDLEDDVLDAKVSRIGRLIDITQGASADDIKAAVQKLKDDEPALFGVAAGTKTKKIPDSDPPGNPRQKRTENEDSMAAGAARAKATAQRSGYPILGSGTN